MRIGEEMEIEKFVVGPEDGWLIMGTVGQAPHHDFIRWVRDEEVDQRLGLHVGLNERVVVRQRGRSRLHAPVHRRACRARARALGTTRAGGGELSAADRHGD